MDANDDLNQENRRQDSKMIEDEIDNKDNIQAVHAYNDQDEIQLSENFLFENRESFEQRIQQINSGFQTQQTNERAFLRNPFFNNHLFDNKVDPNQIFQDEQLQINRKQQIQNRLSQLNRNNVANSGRYTPRISRIQSNFQGIQNLQAQNNSLISQTSSKKRNFRKLLADQSQIPQSQYYPNENEIELQKKFKKLKISHDQDLRQIVDLSQRNFNPKVNSQLNELIFLSQNSNQDN